jgi:ATP-dependent DNA helicase RecQ
MLENVKTDTDEDKRLLYVGMTRAKQNLTIHLNSNFLDNLHAENLERVDDRTSYSASTEIAMNLMYGDVWLDYFINRQYLVSQLTSGDLLTWNGSECLNSKGQPVLKFSKQFNEKVEDLKKRNFALKSARVNFIVYWLKEGTAQEVRVILPEVYFEKLPDPLNNDFETQTHHQD